MPTCFARATLAIFSITDFKSVINVVFYGLVSVAIAIPLFRIATACSRCIDKANEFDDMVFSIIYHKNTEHLARNTRLQLHILNRRKIKFTAFGVFDVDNGLLGKVIVTGITYLVIMLQLKDQFNL
ncbi:hypothetical protein O3M35_012131 [Rhynocoris fuscipes]|uniref:Gustatory receptor n=1 Tax=Rhynocoris fuscipes TaxID=488301 RepID=A0AAW1CUH0_9HEMI